MGSGGRALYRACAARSLGMVPAIGTHAGGNDKETPISRFGYLATSSSAIIIV